jgi:acetylornithine deacetylase
MMELQTAVSDAIELLQRLIRTPSFSREEQHTADLLAEFLQARNIVVHRKGNNVWAKSASWDSSKPTLLLNSHHDTVKPNTAYTRDPFEATIEDGKLFGLGSNDAGGPLVALLATFVYFQGRSDAPCNLVIAATAEEEISGTGGIESIWSDLPHIDFAIVGEPTQTQVAVAEKGLLVLDCISRGRAGHAAREEGDNALYRALPDIEWFRQYKFERVSAALGAVKMSVTVIQAGQAHNQVPAECKFTVDVRVTDAYTLEDVLAEIKKHVQCEVTPRSLRLKPSGIARSHPLVKAAERIGKTLYGSPTTSDQALIPVPSIKMGPGDSARSHAANEYIHLSEIEAGISSYIQLIQHLQQDA